MNKVKINIKEITADLEGWIFLVEVIDGEKISKHTVSLNKKMFDRLNLNRTPLEIVEFSFNFLLEKEGKEDILKSFDLSEIPDYFSDFEKKLNSKLKNLKS